MEKLTEKKIRMAILEALDAGYVTIFADSPEYDNFLSGAKDYRFDELAMDSLAMMEFCISLEINGVITVDPQDVVSFESLNKLVQAIVKRN